MQTSQKRELHTDRNEGQYFLEFELEKGPIFIELQALNSRKFWIKSQYDIIKIYYACQQLIKERNLDVQSPVKKHSTARVTPDYNLMDSATLPRRDAVEIIKGTEKIGKPNHSMLWKNRLGMGGLSGKISRKQSRDKDDLHNTSKTSAFSVSNIDKLTKKNDSNIKNSDKSNLLNSSGKRPVSSQNSNKKELNPGQQIPFKSHQLSGGLYSTDILKKIAQKLSSGKNNFINTEKMGKSKDKSPSKNNIVSARLKGPTSTSFDIGYVKKGNEIVDFIDQPQPGFKNLLVQEIRRNNSVEITPYDSADILSRSDLRTDRVEVQTDRMIAPSKIFPSEYAKQEQFNRRIDHAVPSFPYEGYATRQSPPKATSFIMPQYNFCLTCDWDGIIKQWSQHNHSLYRTYDNPATKGARAMVSTKNSAHLFIGDMDGAISHYSIINETELYFIAKTKQHDIAIRVMAITHDDSFLLSACQNGVVKQFYIHPVAKCLMLKRNWGDFYKFNSPITAISITFDNEYAFIGDKDGILRQFCQKYYSISKQYELPGNHGSINCMAISNNNRSIFLGYRNGFLREVNIYKQQISKDYGWFDKGGIKSIFLTTDCFFMFIGGSNGNLLQFEMVNRKCIKDYGKVLDKNILSLAGTDSNGSLWMVDEGGKMKVMDVREQQFLKCYTISNKAVYCLAQINM